MDDKDRIAGLLNSYRAEIMAKSPKSFAIWQQNRTVMPAGVGSLFKLADPFPMVVKRAEGARVWDADDHDYLDFMLGFSTMILGNTPEEVQAAIREELPRGTHYGQCHEHEYAFARLFCDMAPGVERVAFCNSGTEATMYALRLARATTGRPLIAKFEGGYHGAHDLHRPGAALPQERAAPDAQPCLHVRRAQRRGHHPPDRHLPGRHGGIEGAGRLVTRFKSRTVSTPVCSISPEGPRRQALRETLPDP